MRQYSQLEQRLLNDFQHSLPLSPTPYADLANELGVEESTVIESLDRLQREGVVSRVGAVFRPNRVGVSTLAAMEVQEEQLESVAEIVSGFEEVNHNYERDHQFNLWFVVTATDAKRLQEVLQEISDRTGHEVMDLPMEQDFFIDLGFDLKWT